MKKLCKILTAFVLTVTMVTNMAPQALHAESNIPPNGVQELTDLGITDLRFQEAIVEMFKKNDPAFSTASITKKLLRDAVGEINIKGGELDNINGFALFGENTEIRIENTNLNSLPIENESDLDGKGGPSVKLNNNQINNVYANRMLSGNRLASFEARLQKVKYPTVQGHEAPLFRYTQMNEASTILNHPINLEKELVGDSNKWPVPAPGGADYIGNIQVNDNEPAKSDALVISNSTDLLNQKLLISNPKKTSTIKFDWKITSVYYGNSNPWSGTMSIPVTVQYKEDVSVDDGQNANNEQIVKYGTVSLTDGTGVDYEDANKAGYYEYDSTVIATAVPAKHRKVQYWRLVDDQGTEISGSKDETDNTAKTLSVSDVNHIRTKFTHIADIKNVTNIPNIDAKDTGKVWVDVADRDTVYDGNQSNFFEGSTGINDTEDRIFHYEPATNFLLDKVEVDGDEAKVEVNKDTGTITVKNMQADQHIKVSFKEARKYKVETVVAENGLTSENSTTIDQGKDANPNGKAIYVDVEDSTSKPGISGGTDNVNIHIIPQNDYVIESVVAESTAYDVDGNPIKGPETHVFDGAKGIGNNDGKGFKATLPAIHEDWKITVTFKAVNAIETNVVANGIVKPGVSLDDGINGGTVNGVNTPTNISNIKRGDNQKVVVSPKKDPNDIYQINKITVSEKVGDKYVSLTKEREAELGLDLKLDTAAGTSEDFTIDFKNIRNDFKVEASFYKTHKIPVTAVDNDYYSKNHKDGDTLDNGKDGGTFNNDLLSIPRGDNRDVIVKAKPGYVIESITIKHADNTSTSVDITDPAEMKVPFQNIRSDAEVFVAFVAKYNIDTEIIENGTPFAGDNGLNGGTITPDESDIHRGLDRSVVINAKEGYTISKIIIDGKEIEIGEDLTTYTVPFNNMKDNHEVKVAFVKINEVINKVVGEYPDGGTISPSVKLPDGTGYIIVITPNEGFEVDLDTLKNTGGVITVNDDGTVTITYDHVIKDEFNEVGFKKKPVAPKPAEPTPPTPEKPAPKAEAPTGDTTSTLPLAGLAVASLAACGIILKKRKSNMK